MATALNHYIIQLTGSSVIRAIEITEQFSTDDAAIGWACGYAKNYYPVYFQGCIWRLDPIDQGGKPRLIATLTAEVTVKAARSSKATAA
jgi:hypothetical protein